MDEHLQYFRPGEESRMLARCQFALTRDGKCGAMMTYPMKGFPWRRNPSKSFEFEISVDLAESLFDEVASIKECAPDHCLDDTALWCDHSEKANGITRDDKTNTLCHTIAVYDGDQQSSIHYYSMKEDSEVLRSSELFKTIMSLIAPHERL